MIRKHLRAPTGRDLVCFALGGCCAVAIMALLWPRITSDPERMRTALLANPEFLADHPEVLDAARSVLHSRALASRGAVRAELVRGKWATFTHAAFAPGIGDPGASRTLIEFTDYTCAPCKVSEPAVRRALAAHADLRVAIMLLPTGGAISELAARVALAAYRQNPGQFGKLHHLLMAHERPLTQDIIMASAAAAGLDLERLQREIGDSQHRHHLEQMRAFAADLGISGVPAFAMNGQLLLGGVSPSSLRSLLQAAAADGAPASTARP